MSRVVTFGEVLLRLSPDVGTRILQANKLAVNYGGSEANVASSLALLGDSATLVSKVPNNMLGKAAVKNFRGLGVDTSQIKIGGQRLGIYFFEKGASVRGTKVIYDRNNSSFATCDDSEFDWKVILKDADYFYFSGITAAISDELRKLLIDAVKFCKDNDIKVVCDLNYRGKLWTPSEAQRFMGKIMPFVTVCIANDEDFKQSLGIDAFDGDMTRGIEQKSDFIRGMKTIKNKYPNVEIVASVLRNIYSVEKSTWMALMLKDGNVYESPQYKLHALEGVAGGDAFGAGLMHGLVNNYADQKCIDFAIAASVSKLTIVGDLNISSQEDIEEVMNSDTAVRLAR